MSESQRNSELATLKAELEIELKNKKQCAYQGYECTQLSLENYMYCGKHILSDKTAPFKQCAYIYSNVNKRCNLPAPKCDKKENVYCLEHAVKTMVTKQNDSTKGSSQSSADIIIDSLVHYGSKSCGNYSQTGPSDLSISNTSKDPDHATNPFKHIDVEGIFNNASNDFIDLGNSESDEDTDNCTFGSLWHDYHIDSSDNESVDSEQEDVLKNAGVYTSDEVVRITRDKLVKLQSLYIDQYRYLQHVLREKRRKYLHNLKREQETCSNIYSQSRENPKEQVLYKKLKALKRYHQSRGTDAILNRRLRDLRLQMTEGTHSRHGAYNKCAYNDCGMRCQEKPLPMAKHCRKHILEDRNQVLFKACGALMDNEECKTPVENMFEDSRCHLHTHLRPTRSYSHMRKNSDSDMDDSIGPTDNVVDNVALNLTLGGDDDVFVKHETIETVMNITDDIKDDLKFELDNKDFFETDRDTNADLELEA